MPDTIDSIAVEVGRLCLDISLECVAVRLSSPDANYKELARCPESGLQVESYIQPDPSLSIWTVVPPNIFI
jgi:hypothetical protein